MGICTRTVWYSLFIVCLFQRSIRIDMKNSYDATEEQILDYKLSKAIEALKKITLYVAYNGDTWPSDVAKEVLKEIGEE